MLPISVTIIAKNEEACIGECLKRLSCFDWEIIVVDTGSTDRTVEIARRYTPHVFLFPWVNDFSAAKNYAVSKASHDYILSVDCDEYLQTETLDENLLRSLCRLVNQAKAGMVELLNPYAPLSAENTGASSCATHTSGMDAASGPSPASGMDAASGPSPASSMDAASGPSLASSMDAASGPSPASSMDAASGPGAAHGPSQTMVHDRVARFFNRKYVRYEGKVHEQLTSTSSTPLTFAPLPLTFYHAGYRTMELKRAKTARNLPLLEAQLQEEGDNPYTLFQLGQSYFGLSDFAHALPYFERALEMDVNENEEYVQTLVESYGYCLLYLKQYAKALELEGVYPVFSKRADFVFLMGLVYMNNAMFAKAIREFQKATQIPVCCVEGVNSYSAYYNIGVIYECLGQQKEALDYYKKCGGYPPALERRGSLHENTIS